MSSEGDRSVKNADVQPAVTELMETSVGCECICVYTGMCMHACTHVFVHPPTCISLSSFAIREDNCEVLCWREMHKF